MQRQNQQQQDHAVQRASIIDEFGELSRQIAVWQPVIRRRDELRRIIENWYALGDPQLGGIEYGNVYQVVIGPRAEHRIIDCRLLFEQLGDEFFDNCTYPLKFFDALKINKSGLSKQERIGNRSVVAVLINAAAVATVEEKLQNRHGRGRPRKAA